jgi:hypothetical protein
MSNKILTERLAAHARLVALRVLAEIDPDALLRRLILRLLATAPGYGASVSVIADVLHACRIRPGRDRIATQSAWLAEQGLAALIGGDVPGAALTNRGLDAAQDAVTIPGVAETPTTAWLSRRLADALIMMSVEGVIDMTARLAHAGLVQIDAGMIMLTDKGGEVISGRLKVDDVHTPSPSSIMAAAAASAKALLVKG